MGEEDTNALNIPRLAILMIGFASAAAVVLIYHCFAIGWCNRWRSFRDHQQGQGLPSRQEETLSSLEHSTIQLIPAHKYRKKAGPVGEDSGTCAVCLSEFQEGEELRTLPACKHSFHVPCIDMWLYSHSNCPLCRAETMPDHVCSPELQYLRMLQEFGGQSR